MAVDTLSFSWQLRLNPKRANALKLPRIPMIKRWCPMAYFSLLKAGTFDVQVSKGGYTQYIQG
jgi:hypothetical protein